jgi:chromatin segregation and condensation protein Rec8/ScpA/Scc1 (kleisin family)
VNESLETESGSPTTPGTKRLTASTIAIAGISPPVRTYGPTDTKEILDSISIAIKEEQSNFCLFSKLVRSFNIQKKIYTLLCLLYLFQDEKIELYQEKIFDEIFLLKG